MPQIRRRKKIVDRHVQGTIIWRVVYYWLACMLFLTLPNLVVMAMVDWKHSLGEHAMNMASRYWPVYLLMGIMLPLLLHDAMSVSNRFCGPVQRILRRLNEYNDSGEYEEINLRDDDFWQGVANALNTAIAKRANET